MARAANILLSAMASISMLLDDGAASAADVPSAKSDATLIATRLGRVIGVAWACGVPETYLRDLRSKTRNWLQEASISNDDVAAAEAILRTAVLEGSASIWRTGGGPCRDGIEEFHRFAGQRRGS